VSSLLILDDNQDTLFVLKEFLQTAFNPVAQARTVAEAERALAEQRFTHLLLDYRVGSRTLAPALISRWRADHPDIAYVAIFTGVQLERHSWPEGCDEVFQKPDDLHRLLRTMLDLGAADSDPAKESPPSAPAPHDG